MIFGRREQFDERSRGYSLEAKYKFRSYTWRCNQWLNQGQEGACVGAAVGHELIARPAEVTSIDMRYVEKKIYWEAQKIDPWPGGAYPGASEHYDGTSVLAGVKAAQRLGWFNSYYWAFSIEALIYGVGHRGPCIIGVPWYSGMMDVDTKGFIHPTGSMVGGHSVIIRAVDLPNETLLGRNSWGKRWGINGDFKISFSALTSLLRQNGEAVFLLNRHKTIKGR